jgi:prolipoprotein diacylglyceryltransferase
MQILVFIPSLLLFLYILYRMVKDDYIFIKKGISLEQSFDIAFIIMWVSLFLSRLLYSLFHTYPGQNILFDFFTPRKGGFSLTGAIIGGIIVVCLIGRYKRLPLGRLSDFLSLSLLYTLPLLFLSDALLAKRNELLFLFLNAVVYFVVLLFFVQFLYPKVMNRTIKEGILAIFFLLCFSLISLVTSLLMSLKNILNFINPENIILTALFIFSLVIFIRLEKSSHNRRIIIR